MQAGNAPQPDADNIGTHDFSKQPEAVIFGRGIDGPIVEEIFNACGGTSSGLVWLRSSDEGVAKVRAKPPTEEEMDGYADKIAKLIKDAVWKIKTDGGWGGGGVYTYGEQGE